ncbi:MAG: phytoene/squalene synthase family protein [Weeksellaceae bacterium]|nr:phytoene/squalene synthase family protein [Weeksellaceae bacterium]
MTNRQLYDKVSFGAAAMVTKKYSSSFSRSILFLSPEIRRNIYNIYGFVRLADEIADTFHIPQKEEMFNEFCQEYQHSLQRGISTNPIIHAFIVTQQKYAIPQHLVDSFLHSMRMDLGDMQHLTGQKYREYIYGSAEVVGLMCLVVFVRGDQDKYQQLKPYAQSLGAAFQKVNFLRDLQADYSQLNRSYFPGIDFDQFTDTDKIQIEREIQNDFDHAIQGIRQLPIDSRYAVYLAYKYYNRLLSKIKKRTPHHIQHHRVRVNNFEKVVLFSKVMVYKTIKITK